MRRPTDSVKGTVGAEVVGEDVDMEETRLLELTTKVSELERWRNDQVNPWIISVDEKLEEIDLNEKETATVLNNVVSKIQKLENHAGCIYVRDVIILSSIILIVVFIIILIF
jgi:hypothetical protein